MDFSPENLGDDGGGNREQEWLLPPVLSKPLYHSSVSRGRSLKNGCAFSRFMVSYSGRNAIVTLIRPKQRKDDMSVAIRIEHAVKRYGEHTVIPDLTLQIERGEFFTLLGPSGCGKTTLLRMIAGFNAIEGGSFYFDDRRINDADPGSRNIGMVFQNYAIFPHMTVRQNVAFGLKNRRTARDVIDRETEEFLKLVKIEQHADKKQIGRAHV